MKQASQYPFDLVASDYDLTLATYPGGVVGKRTLDGLSKIRDLGVHLAVISGRSTRGLSNHLRRHEFDFEGLYVVGYNGAEVTQGWDQTVIASFPLEASVVETVMSALEGHPVQAIVPHGDLVFTDDAEGILARHESKDNRTTVEQISGWDDLEFSPHKILMGGEQGELEKTVRYLRSTLGDSVELAFSAPMLVEINAKGVSKGLALGALCDHLGVTTQRTLTFGDNENDIPLLQAAGLGVAMDNALPSVKSIADRITGPVHEDGVADVLEDIFGF